MNWHWWDWITIPLSLVIGHYMGRWLSRAYYRWRAWYLRITPELSAALQEIQRWGVDEIDEETRRAILLQAGEVLTANNETRGTFLGVNWHGTPMRPLIGPSSLQIALYALQREQHAVDGIWLECCRLQIMAERHGIDLDTNADMLRRHGYAEIDDEHDNDP